MKAYILTGHGGFDKLVLRDDFPCPQPGDYEILVKVAACGLNNTDVNTRVGWYSKSVVGATDGEAAGGDADDGGWGGALQFPRVQGADVCGHIIKVGAKIPAGLMNKRVLIDPWLRDWDSPGDLNKCGYFGSECDGGFAEFTCVDYRQVHPINCDLSDVELATFATAYITAENMLTLAGVDNSDTILISGASGGVGCALVQLANLRGAKTIALAAEEKHPAMQNVGADILLPRAPRNLSDALYKNIGAREVSVVADVVGGKAFGDFIGALKTGGRYVCAGAIAGAVVEFDLRDLYLKCLKFFGATITPPDMFAKLVKYIEDGKLKPLLAGVYPLCELPEAQKQFIAKKQIGNFVVQA